MLYNIAKNIIKVSEALIVRASPKLNNVTTITGLKYSFSLLTH